VVNRSSGGSPASLRRGPIGLLSVRALRPSLRLIPPFDGLLSRRFPNAARFTNASSHFQGGRKPNPAKPSTSNAGLVGAHPRWIFRRRPGLSAHAIQVFNGCFQVQHGSDRRRSAALKRLGFPPRFARFLGKQTKPGSVTGMPGAPFWSSNQVSHGELITTTFDAVPASQTYVLLRLNV